MRTSPLPTRESAAVIPVATERILVALSDFERRNFLPQLAEFDFGNAALHTFDTDHTAASDWAEVVEEFRPTVLLSAWSTPPWPEGYLDDPDCPVRYVCHTTGSVRWVASRNFIARGGIVTNWGASVAPSVAEHALLLVLAALRCQPAWQPFLDLPTDQQSRNTFTIPTRSLFDRKVCVHGFGLIARQFIRLLEPFRAQCFVYSQNVPASAIEAAGATMCGSLEELFDQAEILVECEALNPQTRGSVTAELLASLADDAVFVNVGRGAVVDEAALIRHATDGKIRVALDVFAKEPLPPDSPLRIAPNAILSPHLAGPTRDHMAHCGRYALEHLAAYLRGEPVPDAFTPEIYDRST